MEEKSLSSNMEDYLEAIAILSEQDGIARVKDISKLLNVKTPSVNNALNILSKNGLVIHERYSFVKLTKEGKKIANNVQKRHNVLLRFLTNILSIDREIASEDACKMEHTLSPKTFERLSKFIEFVESCPDPERPYWLKSLDYYFKTGRHRKCEARKANQALK